MDEEMRIKNSEIEDNFISENKVLDNSNHESLIEDKAGEVRIDRASDVITDRKEKVFNFFRKRNAWVIGLLIVALILGVYIRSMPMQDHGGNPGLWDIATDDWTLGPDLDPWLFTRYAKTIVEEGSLPKMDMMRNVPLGYDTLTETQLLPKMIVWTYYFFDIFMDIPVEYAAAIFPVIMFALTLIVYFFFVREFFTRKSEKAKTRANIIALISTFFIIVIPVFLPRTIAGIPEKESAGFFFMFLALYLFLRAWKSDKIRTALILSILSGIFTAMLGLIWGGVVYVFVTLAVVSFLSFIIGKTKIKESLIYFSWFIVSLVVLLGFTDKYTLIGLIQSSNYLPAFAVFFILFVDLGLKYFPIHKNQYFKKMKVPESFSVLIISIVLGLILVTIAFGPGFILDKAAEVSKNFISPITGRWSSTVAENRQPYFNEWESNFGPFVKSVPLMFWLFFSGSVLMVRKMLNKLKKKDAWILTGLYVLFFFGLVFSRYSSSHILNGENLISKIFYFGSFLLFAGFFVYYYIKDYRAGENSFQKLDIEYLMLFVLFVLCLFTARSAVRLIMVLGTIAPIFVGFLIVESILLFKKTKKDEVMKILMGSLIIVILIASVFTFWTFYQTVKVQAYNQVPSHYNQQWQKSMSWVRENTSEDAVFAHWWDYGYWVQSIGNRATVLDGGNAIAYWNYLMGRHVLTGDNQADSLEFLYNHEADYLLIDSSDIGKYGAFSSIGSNDDYDRYSWVGTFLLDGSQTQETKNETIFVYPGGIALDEDLIIQSDGKEILLPERKTGVGAMIISSKSQSDDELEFTQPKMIAVYQGQQHIVYLKYLYVAGQFVEFEDGIEACAYIFPKLDISGQGVSPNPLGAVMYLSPRLMRGYLAQKYLLNDPFNKFPNFKLVHSQPNLILESLTNQGLDLPEFVYYQGVQGPIKIWEIEYTGNEKPNQEYVDIDQSKYLNWTL